MISGKPFPLNHASRHDQKGSRRTPHSPAFDPGNVRPPRVPIWSRKQRKVAATFHSKERKVKLKHTRTDLAVSPLAPAFGRMAEMKDELYLFARLGEPEGDGWVSMSKFVEDGDFVGEQLRTMKERWDVDNRSAAIGVVGGLAWQVGGAALFVYAAERRVPDLSPESVMLRLADDGLAEVAFVSGRFAALADDPESESATTLFENEDGLRSHLREGLEAMLEPVVDHSRAATRVSKRTMWNRASDLIGQRLLQFGETLADKEWCGHEAEKLVKSPGSPLDGATRFFVVEHGGREEVHLVRGCCCHGYKDPEHGYCATCPLLSREELEKRAVEAMSG